MSKPMESGTRPAGFERVRSKLADHDTPLIAAFSEDQFALEQIDRLQQVDRSGGIEEMHIPTDSAGIAMRRHLKALSDREQLAG